MLDRTRRGLLVLSTLTLVGCAVGGLTHDGGRDVPIMGMVDGSDAPHSETGTDGSTNPCAAASACGACTTVSGCGWCWATNRCMPGNATGSTDGSCGGANWNTNGAMCTHDAGTDPCTGTGSCTGCTGISGCGWCLTTNRCLQGSASGSHDGSCTGSSWATSSSSCPSGCTAPLMMCGFTCVDVTSDNGNCGSCGHACSGSMTCSGGTCGCSSGLTVCGSTCANLNSDNSNCGSCGNACTGTATCMSGMCITPGPANDTRAGAVAISLTTAEAVVNGTTTGATHDGPSVPCGCTSQGDVWYSVTISAPTVLYFDTAGSSYDTSLIITDSSGNPVPAQAGNGQSNMGLCDDDSGCGMTGGFTSGLQSRTWGDFSAGTYYIVVGGCATGTFTLRVQQIPHSVGSFFYAGRFSGNSTTATILVGTSAATPTCTIGNSGEDVRWMVTCGANEFFSLCQSDCVAGTCGTYLRQSGTTYYDPVMYLRSANTGTEVACDDDGITMGGTNCQGTGGDTSNYGSRLNNVALPRGIGALFVDERLEPNGMTYTLVYNVQ